MPNGITLIQAVPGQQGLRLTHCIAVPGGLMGLSILALATGRTIAALSLLVAALACSWSARVMLQRMQTVRESKAFLSRQLLQSQKLAAIGEIASGIAHEINTPLGVIGMEVEWMEHLLDQEGYFSKVNREMAAALKRVGGEVDRCREITHRMLNFARQKDMVIQETDLNELVEDMVLLVEKEVEERGICVVRDYDGALPPVGTDSPMLRQVVLNLLNNAAQALGQEGCITVRTDLMDRGQVGIRVKDNGPGIPPEFQERIFTPFFTTREPGKGTGLGLPISLAIVTRLGGTLEVVSRPGEGAEFIITLPIDSGKACVLAGGKEEVALHERHP